MIVSRDQEGQGLIEYALLLLLIAIVLVAVFAVFGITLGGVFSEINRCLPSGGTNC